MSKENYEKSALDKAVDKNMGYKEGSQKDESLDKKAVERFSGKGTKARLNTAAHKMFFKSKVSQ